MQRTSHISDFADGAGDARPRGRVPWSPLAMLRGFFGIPFHARTYLRLAYLALSFPLGLAYFVYLVVGISVGGALAIVYVGVLLLMFMLYSWGIVVEADRRLTNALVGTRIPALPFLSRPVRWWTWAGLKARVANQATWRGLVYLFLRFPQASLRSS